MLQIIQELAREAEGVKRIPKAILHISSINECCLFKMQISHGPRD